MCIVSVLLHQNKGGMGNPSLMPKRISMVEGNLEGRGGGFPHNSRILVEYGHSIHHNLLAFIAIIPHQQGCIQNFVPTVWMLSVKINPSLIMMKELSIIPLFTDIWLDVDELLSALYYHHLPHLIYILQMARGILTNPHNQRCARLTEFFMYSSSSVHRCWWS